MDSTIELPDGRTVGYATYGSPHGVPVVWCHGGPGSRLDPLHWDVEAAEANLLLIGIDRPGYGTSTPLPGRSISDWIPDALAVTNKLGIDKFVAIGVSTGGAYALALAALVPHRVLGVVACCSMTDMRYEQARATMSYPHCQAVWDAPDRYSALAAAIDAHGEGGSKMMDGGMSEVLAPSDDILFRDPAWMQKSMAIFPEMFTHGLEGYTDDRRADGGGWVTFDVTTIGCRVTVLHGGMDRMCSQVNAIHTAEVVPHATLDLYEDLGHFSIETKLIATINELLTT